MQPRYIPSVKRIVGGAVTRFKLKEIVIIFVSFQILLPLPSHTFHPQPRRNKYLSNQIIHQNHTKSNVKLFSFPSINQPFAITLSYTWKKANIYKTKHKDPPVRINIPLKESKKNQEEEEKETSIKSLSLLEKEREEKQAAWRRGRKGYRKERERERARVWQARGLVLPYVTDSRGSADSWATGRFTGSWTGHNSPPPDNS